MTSKSRKPPRVKLDTLSHDLVKRLTWGRIIGVDPGKSGAIVGVDFSTSKRGRIVFQTRMPLIRGTRIFDRPEIGRLFSSFKPDAVIQEFVHSRPENGVKQAFEFGRSAEICATVSGVFGFPFIEVATKTWQNQVPNYDSTKESIVKAAKRRWPDLQLDKKVLWGVADAAWIALSRIEAVIRSRQL